MWSVTARSGSPTLAPLTATRCSRSDWSPGFHVVAAGRYGRQGRSGARRSGCQVLPRRRQGSYSAVRPPITLQDLATHTSGLPRLPTNLVITNMDNPYANYSVENLHEFLSGYVLTRDIGSQFEYSNLGRASSVTRSHCGPGPITKRCLRRASSDHWRCGRAPFN